MPVSKAQQVERDAERLYSALSNLVRVYQFRDRDKICCYDISVTQCHALEAVDRHGPRTSNELAAELYLDKSTTSRVVTTLERKGYVTRQAHPKDRRSVLIDLTPTGRKLLTKIQADLVAETRELLDDFDPAVRDAAPRLLDKLASAAQRRFERSACGTGPGGCC
jgi:MarR family 2-MHQ and catechol resistance regulon transcriptional repressor